MQKQLNSYKNVRCLICKEMKPMEVNWKNRGFYKITEKTHFHETPECQSCKSQKGGKMRDHLYTEKYSQNLDAPPEELIGLTRAEEALISIGLPIVTIFTTKGP